MSTAAIATTTTNNKRASKRFSFAGFSLFNKSNNNTNNFDSKNTTTSPVEENKSQPPSAPSQEDVSNDDERKRRRRAQKSQSLYLQSFRNLTSNNNKSRPTSTQYDPAEVQQANHKEVRSSIRRSLSAVLYATPQSKQQQQSGGSAGLVPVLVTQDLSDRHGGMITSDDIEKKQEQTVKKKKEKSVEYDNTLDIIADDKENQLVIIWQGYGYLHSMKKKDKEEGGEEQQQQQEEEQQKELADKDVSLDNTKENLDNRFEKEIWSGYRGLVHPLHLFQDNPEDETETQEKWAALSVDELRRYFDNYGSMLLKLRDASMKRQQRQYLVMNDKTKEDWIIPQANEIPSSPTSI